MASTLTPSVRRLSSGPAGPYLPMPVGPGAGIPGGAVPLGNPASNPAAPGPGGTAGPATTLPTTPDGGIDWAKWVGLALAGYQVYNAAQSSQQAGDLQDQALGHANEVWAMGEPLRAKGLSGLLTPKVTNLSSVYRDPTNPFATASAAPAAPAPATPPIVTPVPTLPTTGGGIFARTRPPAPTLPTTGGGLFARTRRLDGAPVQFMGSTRVR